MVPAQAVWAAMGPSHHQDMARIQGYPPKLVRLRMDSRVEIPFGLLIGSAWALIFTGAGSVLTLMLVALLR